VMEVKTQQNEPVAKPLSEKQWAEVMERGLLRCKVCDLEKPLGDFPGYIFRGQKRYKRSCRKCWNSQGREEYRRRWWRRRRCKELGVPPETFDLLVQSQCGCCAICNRPLSQDRHVIDHDHATGAVRGVVHNLCNLVIGNAKDDVVVLASAIRYLHSHNPSNANTPESLIGRTVRLEIMP